MTTGTVDITAEANQQLAAVLEEEFEGRGSVCIEPASGARSNAKTHYVAHDANGDSFSLKYVSGHRDRDTGELFRTENIYIAGELSKILDAPTHIQCVMVDAIPGLGMLANHRFAIRKWHGEPFTKCRESILASLDHFLAQYGQWFAFGLLFALCDGKPEHWTWRDSDRTVGRCDLECLLYQWGKPGDFSGPLEFLGVRRSIAQGHGREHDVFTSGLHLMAEKFRDRREAVEDLLSRYDHAQEFLASHGWAAKTPDELVKRVVAFLGEK